MRRSLILATLAALASSISGANASIGIGGGGNFLVGGPANAYALQPLSVQGQTGLNLAAGIAGLELQPVEFAPRRHHHRRHHRRG